MTQEQTEGNYLIAKFDGLNGINPPDYHKDWNALMPAIDRIDGLTLDGSICCQTYHTYNTFYIHYNISSNGKGQTYPTNIQYPKYCDGRHRAEGELRIENVWSAVVQFIQWYNTTKK